MSRTVVQVLEIIPDIEPTHLLKLIQRHLDIQHVDAEGTTTAALDPYEVALQRVLHGLFETPDYPKVSRKRKRSSDEGAEEAGPAKTRKIEELDYGSKDRAHLGGKHYDELALVSLPYRLTVKANTYLSAQNQLSQDFPHIPYDQVHQRFAEHNRLYAPTSLSLHAQRRATASGSDGTARSSGRKRKGKGKARHDPEFEKERAWLIRKLHEGAALHGVEEGEGEGLECGCCFSAYPFVRLYGYIPTSLLIPCIVLLEQNDAVPGRPSFLRRLRHDLRCDTPRRAQSRDRLHGPVWMQAALPTIGAPPDPHAEAARTV